MRCGACRGEHATVADVRACHQPAGGAGPPEPTSAREVASSAPLHGPPSAAAVGDGTGRRDDSTALDVDDALAALAGAGLAPEVLLHLRRGRRR